MKILKIKKRFFMVLNNLSLFAVINYYGSSKYTQDKKKIKKIMKGQFLVDMDPIFLILMIGL